MSDAVDYDDEDMMGPAIVNAEDDGIIDIDDPSTRFNIFMPAVQSLVNALGGYEELETSPGKLETVYRPGDSVLAVLKDLKKLWRKDDVDDERTVARCMAKAGLMKELIALLVECTDRGEWGRKVALVACDLIAALTWPIDVAQELKELEDEPGVVTDYASLLRAQLEYKAMLIQTTGPLRCVLSLMLPSLAKPRKEEKDERIISLGLHIIRNLLSIKDAVVTINASGEKEELAYLQAGLIKHLSQLTYFQLFLTLASCADKGDLNQYNVLVLDILHLVFRGVKPRTLAKDQSRASLDQLNKLLELERKEKALATRAGATRHSRFGTTIQVKAGDQRLILHKQDAIRTDPGKILDQGKKKRAVRAKKVDELTQPANLDSDAMRILQSFAKEFLKNCFNTFFASILKDIRMERSKIRPSDNIRTFFLSRFFMEYLLLLRGREAQEVKDRQKKGLDVEEGKTELVLGLVGEMAEMDSVRWVVTRMKVSMDERPPAWTELQASIDCFTQILLLLEAMSLSGEAEDQEVAEILQHQLYYNGDVLDAAYAVIAQYKDQSVAYLDSVIHFAYVLLRMLERYSKNNAYMYVRKRKAARRKRKILANDPDARRQMPEEYDGEGEGEDDAGPDKDAPSFKEHNFTFQAFEMRFAQEPIVNTLMTYLMRYEEFDDPEQLKRVVGLIHRQVVRTKAEGLYFRIGALSLFRKILDDRTTLPKSDATNDLIQLINYILRKFFKKVADDPFLIVQTLAPKGRGKWKEYSSYKSEEEDDDGMAGQKARIKEQMSAAELEFRKNKHLTWSQQMEVVVVVLLQAGREAWIKWIIEVLEIAHAARTEVVLAVDGLNGGQMDANDDIDDDRRVRNFGGPSKEAIDKFVSHDLIADNDEQKAAVKKDSHFRLMLQLLAFERSEDELDPVDSERWTIPAKVLPSNLSTSIGALKQYLANPPSLSEDPKSLLQKKRKRRLRLQSNGGGGSDEDEEEQPRRARKKKVAEMQVFKSAAFIVDSDDDADDDVSFFERERLLREEMDKEAAMQIERARLAMERGAVKGKGKGKGKGKQKETGGSMTARESGNGDGGSEADEEEMELDRDDSGDRPNGHSSSVSDGVSEDEAGRSKRTSSDALGSDMDEPEPLRKRVVSRRIVQDEDDSD